MASNLIAMASNLIGMASNLLARCVTILVGEIEVLCIFGALNYTCSKTKNELEESKASNR